MNKNLINIFFEFDIKDDTLLIKLENAITKVKTKFPVNHFKESNITLVMGRIIFDQKFLIIDLKVLLIFLN